MKEIMILLKKDFDRSFSFLLSPKTVLRDRKIRNAVIVNSLLFAILIFLYSQYRKFLSNFYHDLIREGMGPVMIHSGFIASVAVIALLSIGIIAGEVFFSSDVDILLRFPVKPINILLSKWISLIIGFSLIGVLFFLPLFVKYYEVTNRSLQFLVPVFLAVLSHITIVLSVFSFVVILVMSYLNRVPRIKNILQFLGLAFILFLNFYLQFHLRSLIVQNSITDLSMTLYAYRFYVPQLFFIDRIVHSSSVLTALGYSVSMFSISMICLFLCSYLSTKFMLKGIVSNKVSIKFNDKRKVRVKDRCKYRSALMELAFKDMKEMLKVPIYFFNVSMGALMPIFFLVFALLQGEKDKTMHFVDAVRKFFSEIVMMDQIFWGVSIGFLLAMIIGTIQQSAVSSITREGKRIWIIKVLPISYQDQINGRILGSMIFQIFGLIPTTAILFYILLPDFLFMMSYLLGAFIGAWLICNVGLMMDVMAPKLNWDTPQQAIKQNFKIALFVLLSWAYLFSLFFFSSKFYAMGVMSKEQMKISAVIVILFHFVAGYIINRLSIKLISRNLIHYEL